MDPNAELFEKGVPVEIPVGKAALHGDLTIPDQALGLIIFVHGSGSRSANNVHAATELNEQQFATLLVDLLTREEQKIDAETMGFRFDISLLSARSIAVTEWVLRDPNTAQLPIGLLGTGVGTAAALIAASVMKKQVAAVVSRGGRAALAEEALTSVISPTLLIVGSEDQRVLDLNRRSMVRIAAICELRIIPGAGHLFEEPGAMGQATTAAAEWFARYLKGSAKPKMMVS